MKNIVISGINLFQGGTLSIYYDCLDSIIANGVNKKYNVTAFVHKTELFEKYREKINIIQLPLSRKSYLFRLYYEYVYFYFVSLKKDIDIWISIHDITPNVLAKNIYTYCHNPTPFLKPDKKIRKYNRTVYFMAKFYKYLYKINIKRNTAVIVQQEWIRQEFKKMYHINNIIVAKPIILVDINHKKKLVCNDKKVFIYPAVGRPFKNHEVICQAVELLEKQSYKFEVIFTVDGTENKYTKYLYKKYCHLHSIKWLGFLSRNKVYELYEGSDCLIFPSLLETWGLPISECVALEKDMILADLPYSHETVGNYTQCTFFKPKNANELKIKMEDIITNKNKMEGNVAIQYEKPSANNWGELMQLILEV